MHTPQDIQQALDDAFTRQIALITSLTSAQLAPPYHPGINPPLWEGGHVAFFYEVFLLRPWLGKTPLMPGQDGLWDSFDIDHEDRWATGVVPPMERVLSYMHQIREALQSCLETRPLTPQDRYLYRYAIAHQHMHIESMTWARQTLGYPPPPFTRMEPPLAAGGMRKGDVVVPPGRYRIGMSITGAAAHQADADFAFDCEKPGFEVELPGFRISPTLVSNAEFLAFVEDGGYARPAWWSRGGRKWLQGQALLDRDMIRPQDPAGITAPLYWRRTGDGWQLRQFDRWQPLEPEAPVLHVSYWEAEAWCNWAGRRLPTEYEWEVAALGRPAGAPRRRYPWGDGMDAVRVDMDATRLPRSPVTALAVGDSPLGCRQMLGTAWEWTASQFLPYAGFTHDMYPYMSTLQFGYHKTTRGGSWATSSGIIRGTYRQAYLPHRRDVFVGFRSCAP